MPQSKYLPEGTVFCPFCSPRDHHGKLILSELVIKPKGDFLPHVREQHPDVKITTERHAD